MKKFLFTLALTTAATAMAQTGTTRRARNAPAPVVVVDTTAYPAATETPAGAQSVGFFVAEDPAVTYSRLLGANNIEIGGIAGFDLLDGGGPATVGFGLNAGATLNMPLGTSGVFVFKPIGIYPGIILSKSGGSDLNFGFSAVAPFLGVGVNAGSVELVLSPTFTFARLNSVNTINITVIDANVRVHF